MVQSYQAVERISECLIYLLLVFGPWAFGCAPSKHLTQWEIFRCHQPWTVWTFTLGGCVLGFVLLLKIAIRIFGYSPSRWQAGFENSQPTSPNEFLSRCFVRALFVCTCGILAYCVTSVLNARSTYVPDQFRFAYFNYVRWLPHSYDRASSWQLLLNYIGLAGAFWGIRDWLLGKTLFEIRAERQTDGEKQTAKVTLLPARLRRLLWVLAINGTLLGIESVAQRLSGTGKLLWLIQPAINRAAEDQFGPYAYRSNAAQYFNLLWPLALALWWTLHRGAQISRERGLRQKSFPRHFLLCCVIVMAVCPLITLSRAGAIVALGQLVLAAVIIASAMRRAHGAAKFGLFAFFATILVLGFAFGSEKLGSRMREFELGYNGRENTYTMARPMADEHPLFGTGPGTFAVLFQFYRTDEDTYWPAQLHNDWLETRITFGWIGSSLIAGAFLSVLARRFFPGAIRCGWRFPTLIWLGLAGCLVEARFDFPFQILSVLFLFLVNCAVLSILSRRADG